METTIKHAEEERMKALENARHLFEEHQMLKEQVNAMRANIGLDQMPDSFSGAEANSKIVHKYVLCYLSFLVSFLDRHRFLLIGPIHVKCFQKPH
jgi:Zinc finger-containing protein